jgi:hypothetical protein
MADKRVYFSFHYRDVSDFRANVVRKHKLIGYEDKSAGYLDASIWEEAETKGDLAIKHLINGELDYTSVTAVLVGSDTYDRRWVRYEIMKSVERGNRVLGIHINPIVDKFQQTKSLGPNPFDYLTLSIDVTGTRAQPMEYRDGAWRNYRDLDAFGVIPRPVSERGHAFKLSHWLPIYDWVAGRGRENFSTWIGAN